MSAATAGQIANALAGIYGPVAYRMRYTQRSLSYLYVADMTSAVIDDPTITLDNSRAVVRSFTGLKLLKSAIPASFNLSTSYLAIVMQIYVPESESWEDMPLGLYRLTSTSDVSFGNGPRVIEASGSDVGILLVQGVTTSPYTVASGTNYLTAVTTILTAQGLTSTGFPTTASTTPYAVTWEPGTTWQQIISDLCSGINYYPVWPTATGVFKTTSRGTDPSTESPVATYSDTTEPKMVMGNVAFSVSTDAGKHANTCKVIIDDPLSAAFGYKQSTNNDATSIVSTANQPSQLLTINGTSNPSTKIILSATVAGEIAAFELRTESARGQKGRLFTFPDPRRDAHESYTIQLYGVQAGTTWMVERWQINPGTSMQHEIILSSAVTITVDV